MINGTDRLPNHNHYIVTYDDVNPQIHGPQAYIPIMDGMFQDKRRYKTSALGANATTLTFSNPALPALTNYKSGSNPMTNGFRRASTSSYPYYLVTNPWSGFTNATDTYTMKFPPRAEPAFFPKTGFHARIPDNHTISGPDDTINNQLLSLKKWKDINIRSANFGQMPGTTTYTNDKHPLRMIYDNAIKSSRFMNAPDGGGDMLLTVNKRNVLSSKHSVSYYLSSFKIVKFIDPNGIGTAASYALNFLIKTGLDGFIIETRTGQNAQKAKLKIYSPYKGNNSEIDFQQQNYFIDFYVRAAYNVDYTLYFSSPPLPFYYNTW